MSEAAVKGRPVVQGIDASGGCPVEYRFAHARNGNRHLVVVFANIFAPDDYGWSTGVLDGLRSNVLWIRDRFDGGNTYYLCKGMDFSVERSVIGLISRVMKSLGLTPDDVTLWGSSKGGSAALYFGLRYGFRNVVASVPQLRIGTFVRDVYPDTGRHMLGESMTDDNVGVLDAVLPDLLSAGANPDAHLYVVSSPRDEQYASQVEPFLGLLQRYRNFNFLFNDSPLITGHGKVTQRNTPPLLGIAYLLVEGIAPRIGAVRHGNEQPEADSSGIKAFLGSTSVVQNSVAPPTVTLPAAQSATPAGSVHFAGWAPGAVRVSIWENGKYLASAPVGADGAWAWDREQPWSTGDHLVRLFAVDPNGYQSERTDVRFAVAEYTDPHVGVMAPVVRTPGAYQQVPGTAVAFSGFAPGAAQVGFRQNGMLLGSTVVAPESGWSWAPGGAWPEGTHTVEVFAVDAAGAESPATAATFVVLGAAVGTAHTGY
ncbi:hypothetical protein ABZ858_10480 [Streptomyces sp. NPDC047017]|uniref:hypothetical protein n=1 Tax=Streptomyces sp. NPDC047017 TaxID=3155024 RepID=UPI0033F1EB55